MHTPDTLHALDPDSYNALVDAAKARAVTLRREAVGAFWDDLGHYWRFCSHRIDSGQRAAQRLARRHIQHTRQRNA